MLSSGSLLDNRYRLDDRIATGGMGDVWRGTDVVLGRTIAVKVLRSAMLADPEFSARFYGEARMMAAFRHPGVVEVYDYSAGDVTDEDKCAYLVMAYVEGEPLSTRLKEQGRLGVAETMSIVAQAADALHAAHENGTVHRDVKPGNLIVKPNGAVILVDFGVARSAAVTSVTGLNAIVGTALYMAPEQVAKGNVTPGTDIYALGAVAYHCIAGQPPFDGDNALQVALRHLEDEPEPLPANLVPPAVRELITRAMAKHPEDRFASAAEFAEAALAASGSLDWRSQTGTSLSTTGTAMLRPPVIGPAGRTNTSLSNTSSRGHTVRAAGMTGTSLTGTALTRPMSPAAPNRSAAAPRNLLEAAPAAAPAPARPRQTKSQLAVLLMVIGLFVVAGGLAVLIAIRSNDADAKTNPGTGVVPEATEPATEETEEPSLPTQAPTSARQNPPNVATPGKTQTKSPKPTTPSAAPSSQPPSSQPPSSQPPSSQPPTSQPPTEPTNGGSGGPGGGGDDNKIEGIVLPNA